MNCSEPKQGWRTVGGPSADCPQAKTDEADRYKQVLFAKEQGWRTVHKAAPDCPRVELLNILRHEKPSPKIGLSEKEPGLSVGRETTAPKITNTNSLDLAKSKPIVTIFEPEDHKGSR